MPSIIHHQHPRAVCNCLLFFIAKTATVTAYLLESSLAQLKKSRLLFYNDKVNKVFPRIQIKNENI